MHHLTVLPDLILYTLFSVLISHLFFVLFVSLSLSLGLCGRIQVRLLCDLCIRNRNLCSLKSRTGDFSVLLWQIFPI